MRTSTGSLKWFLAHRSASKRAGYLKVSCPFWCRWWDSEPRSAEPSNKLHRQRGNENLYRQFEVVFHPSTVSKKQEYSKEYSCFFGAGGGTRTHTMSPSTDFESVTSANSITPAYRAVRLNNGYIVSYFLEKVKYPRKIFSRVLRFWVSFYSAGVNAFSMAEPAVVVSAELRMV